MSDTVTVYRLGEPPMEVDPARIIWIDRSRIEDGKCSRRRYIRYNYMGNGVVSLGRNEDFVIGGTVHEGMDLLLQGGRFDKAIEVAMDFYNEAPPWPEYILPEQQEILSGDGLHMSLAFLYAYNTRYLAEFLENFEVLEVESEINYLVTQLENPIGRRDLIVMMSRPDGVLRHRKSGRLWHLSHKTYNGVFDELQLKKLDIDMQRFSESLAIQAKYGEPVDGSVYNYFLKGAKRKDDSCNLDRHSNGLIRPYLLRQTPGGDILPEMLAFDYNYDLIDMKTHMLTSKRLGKGWERVAVYNEIDFWLWLEWLNAGWVKPPGAIEGPDYLSQSIAAHVEVPLVQEHAERWLTGLAYSEEDLARRFEYIGRDGFDPTINPLPVFNREIPLEHSECFSYNKECSYHKICWKGVPIPALLDQGKLFHREPNHLQELYEQI